MSVAFYAPMKAPDHPVPSGDRAIARLFLQALAAAGQGPELICHFNSREGSGDPHRQARLQSLGLNLAEALTKRLLHRPVAHRPRAWFTYHLYHKAPDWLGPAVSHALDIPYYLAEASIAPKQAGGPWDSGYRASIGAVAAARRIFVLNPKDAPGLQPHLGPDGQLIPMRPFLDTNPYQAAAQKRQSHRHTLAARHDIPTTDIWLLAVGMMRPGDKQASYRVLQDILPQLSPAVWQLLIAGDGPLRQDIAAAMPAQLQPRLHWLGAQPPDQLPALYAASDLMLWPAVNEAIGMALLEAQSAGLPVVAGDAGAVATIIEPGTTGLLAPPQDAIALAQATSQLMDDSARRQAFARAATAKTARDHSLTAAAAQLANTLGETAP